MKICIIGGGNIGTTLAVYLKNLNRGDRIVLMTSNPSLFSNRIKLNDIENNVSYYSELDLVTNNAKDAVENADMIFITVPSSFREQIFKKISPYVKDGAMVGMLPGVGGCEFIFKKYFNDSVIMFGFQRVPFIARCVVKGSETDLKGWKPYVVVACIPHSKLDDVCSAVTEHTGFVCEKASNYLAVTLTPTNPVLHPSRMYDLFCDTKPQTIFKTKSMFYSDWSDRASEMLFGMDNELQQLVEKIDKIDLRAVKPLSVHYESDTVQKLTAKIRSINSFKLIQSPLIEAEGEGYRADTSTRMFTEDYPFGLALIKGFCEIFGVKTPYIDKNLKFFADYFGYELYTENGFDGKDLNITVIPQNFGLKTVEDIYRFYL